jgi:hypothetical protein
MRRFAQVALLLLMCLGLWADSAGPFSGTGAGTGWTTPTNTASSNDAYATESICASCDSDPLYISNLGFSIPAGSIINGITATYERKCSSTLSCSTDTANGGYVNLSKATAGTPACTDNGTATTWSTSDVTGTWGNASDLWGCSWTAADINGSNFGLVTVVYNNAAGSRTASIDYLAITVAYTPSPGGRRGSIIISQTRSAGAHGGGR